MTKNEILQMILSASEDDDRSFDHTEIARWPEGVFDSLVQIGLLRRAGGSLVATCPECDGAHSEEVTTDWFEGMTRYFINCPEMACVEIEAKHCERWEPCVEGIAQSLREALQLNSAFKELYPQRLWRLGRIAWNGGTREILFARGLERPDAQAVMAKAPPAGKALILVPEHVPDDRGWPGRIPVVIAISEYFELAAGTLLLCTAALLEKIQQSDQILRERGQLSLDEVAKKKVKSTVEECIDERVFRQDVIDAVIRFGGVLQAIEELKAEGKKPPSKATVYRWLNATGGIETLRNRPDWGSMVDLKTSHPGDRAEKVAAATK